MHSSNSCMSKGSHGFLDVFRISNDVIILPIASSWAPAVWKKPLRMKSDNE